MVNSCYDANGNMTYDGDNQTFEWDAANRLVAINYYDTGDRTEFAYDGLGRRVKIVEYGPGVTATIQPSGSSYTTFTTAPFALPAGSYSLTFQGLNPNGGDNVALIDSVALNGTLVANGSFESPLVTDYQAPPSDTAWSYTTDYSGIANDSGNFMSANPSAPAGSQVAFVKNAGLLSQIWSASAGTYTLSFKAAQRGTGNTSHQQLRVNLRPSSSVISTKNFVWCGNQICEERDGSNNVTKRFFNEGEKRIGGSDAGNYYYSRDHLGSIREVTDSTGTLKAQYDYDEWGNSVVVSGNMNVDFGFTGHYFHQPSGLNLALYRAYNPSFGRWISRDPIAERGGTNLYGYTFDDPVDLVDPIGLYINIQGDLAYRIQVRQDLQRIWNADPRLRAMLEQLFRSENFHTLSCPLNSRDENKTNPLSWEDAENGVGASSSIEYDPNNWISPTGEVRDPVIGLTHELRHSEQIDIGIIMDSTNPNSGVSRLEEWGVRRENIMRDVLGYPWKTTYGGLPIQNPEPR